MISLLAQLEFSHPTRLLALAALPVFLYVALRGRPFAAGEVARVVVRAVIVGLLILAVAGLAYRQAVEQNNIVLVADVSQSAAAARDAAKQFIDAVRKAGGNRPPRVLAFAGNTQWLESGKLADARDIDRLASDPTAALSLAEAMAPNDGNVQIVILTDGIATQGDFSSAAGNLRSPVSVVPLAPFAKHEICISELVVHSPGSFDSQTAVDVRIVANSASTGTLRLLVNGKPAAAVELPIAVGQNKHRTMIDIDRTQPAVVTAIIEGFEDTLVENNRRSALAAAAKRGRAMVVSDEPAAVESLSQSLGQGGFDVERTNSDQLPRAADLLAPFDLVVLADVLPRRLNEQAVAALRQYVIAGGGLIVAGGQQTFGVEQLSGIPLEEILPVKSSPREIEKKASLALVLVIDKSDSMKNDDRLKLAKAAAKQTVDSLSADDKVGVIAFGSDTEWVSDIYPCSDKPELRRRIDMLAASGLTDMYPALERACVALEQADADRRHAIVLTDGVSTPGEFDEIARRMAEAGISVSTVSVSPGAEQNILKDIARLAGGRHYHCDDAADIAAILIGDTKRVESADLEYEPIEYLHLPGLALRGAPPLLGYTPTSPQPQAELLLRTAGGDPLLAWRRYGAGITLAFTSQVESGWGAQWKSWPGFERFWTRLAQHTRRNLPPRFDLRIARRGDLATAMLDVVDSNGELADGLAPQASLTHFDAAGNRAAESLPLAMSQIAPGRYAAEFAASEPGVQAVEIFFTDDTGQRQEVSGSLARDYADELRLNSSNDDALRALAAATGGKYDPQPGELLAGGAATYTSLPLWQVLLMAAAVLFTVDVFLRRYRQILGKA